MKSLKASFALSGSALALLWLAAPPAAASLLWIDDTSNNIGTVDTVTGTVSVKGNAGAGFTLSDIGFATNGNLYGTSPTNFYLINQTTGAGTLISALGVGGSGMNALVGAPGGVLYAASFANTSLFSITPSPFAASTFTGSTGAVSAGDLAFASGFYLSGINAASGNDD